MLCGSLSMISWFARRPRSLQLRPCRTATRSSKPTITAVCLAIAPILIVLVVNLLMSFLVLPRVDTGFLAEPRFNTTLAAVSGAWSVVTAWRSRRWRCSGFTGSVCRSRARPWMPAPPPARAQHGQSGGFWRRNCRIAGIRCYATASWPCRAGRRVDCGRRRGHGRNHGVCFRWLDHRAHCARRDLCRDGCRRAHRSGLDASRRVIQLRCTGTLPHNGAAVTLLAICGATQRGSYREIMMVGLIGPLLALAVVIILGRFFGAF